MKCSICIPNCNYERFLGRTIQSVLDQTDQDLEIVIADNASTDGSVAVVRSFDDPRIRLQVNTCNIGLSANLDRTGRMAVGDRMLMLSSDDLLRPDALASYRALFDALEPNAHRAVVTATWDVIDAEDRIIGRKGPDRSIWTEADRVPHLDRIAGGPVYGVNAPDLLRRSLLRMRNPFNFAATCYPRSAFEAVEGYACTRLFNPDKWFHWRLLTVLDRAYFVDRSLVAYRRHSYNQSAVQASTKTLKFSVDEYVSTLEVDDALLAKLDLTRDQVIQAFVEFDVGRHGLATLARNQRPRARRIWDFGRAVYPQFIRANRKAWLLRVLLSLGIVGQKLAQIAYRQYLKKTGRTDSD